MLSSPEGDPEVPGPATPDQVCTCHVGVLGAELEPALGPVVEAVPEAERTLHDRPRVQRCNWRVRLD